jgi:hypothetical protein
MNLNREQFLKAVERGEKLLKELKKDYPELGLKPVFSRFGPRSGQCDLTTDLKNIVMEFPEMLEVEGSVGHEKHENSQRELAKSLRAKPFLRLGGSAEGTTTAEMVEKLRNLLIQLKQGEPVEKEADALEKKLLAPDLPLYCGDVLIEYRPGELKYETLRRLQQDSRLPPGRNTVGNIRVIAGSLQSLSVQESS